MMLNVPKEPKIVAKPYKNYATIQTTTILNQMGLISLHKKRTEKLALENLHLKAKEIWDKLSEELNEIQLT